MFLYPQFLSWQYDCDWMYSFNLEFWEIWEGIIYFIYLFIV